MKLRRLLVVYMSALALLCVSVVASLIVTEMSAAKISSDATDINISGRQRMLSQRIIYLSQDLAYGAETERAAVREELSYAIVELETSIALFETSHALLSGDPDLTNAAQQLYFAAEAGEVTLDQMVQEYLRNARAILADPTDLQALAALRDIERAGLLGRLDQLVSVKEAESQDQVAILRAVGRYSLIVALAIVLIEVAFVFLPGHRMIQRAIDNISDQNRQLQVAWEESETLRAEQAEFTYAVSHDLKSPSNTIRLVLNEIESEHRDEVSDEVAEYLDEVRATVDRIGLQIEDILQFAWATGDAEDRKSVVISECLDEVKANLRGALTEQNGEITLVSDAAFTGFRRQVVVLLQNLCDNGLKYQPPGHPPVLQVTAEPLAGEDGIVLSVTDNGIGISVEDQDKIFGLFVRLHRRSEYSGTGLGLATCKRIVENHRGDISVTSVPGQGTTFRLTLLPPRARGSSVQPMILQEAA